MIVRYIPVQDRRMRLIGSRSAAFFYNEIHKLQNTKDDKILFYNTDKGDTGRHGYAGERLSEDARPFPQRTTT